MTEDDLIRFLLSRFPQLVISADIKGPASIRAVLVDGSYLDIWWNERGRYSYHWQRREGESYRFNNAPHHSHIETYPHHLHSGEEVVASPVRGVTEEDIEKVVAFIAEQIGGSSP